MSLAADARYDALGARIKIDQVRIEVLRPGLNDCYDDGDARMVAWPMRMVEFLIWRHVEKTECCGLVSG